MAQRVLTSRGNYFIYLWYHLLVIKAWINKEQLDFMNLGFVGALESTVKETSEADKLHRQSSLYLKVFEGARDSINHVLEVGSGLGGGTNLAAKYLPGKVVYGVDKLTLSVAYSNSKFKKDNIEFFRATSENFPSVIGDVKFDFVFSVEASQHFPEESKFFTNVSNALTSNGRLHYADVFRVEAVAKVETEMERASLAILHKEDITSGVLQSIDSSSTSGGVMGYLEDILLNKQGVNFTKGSEFHNQLKEGKLVYIKYILGKAQQT